MYQHRQTMPVSNNVSSSRKKTISYFHVWASRAQLGLVFVCRISNENLHGLFLSSSPSSPISCLGGFFAQAGTACQIQRAAQSSYLVSQSYPLPVIPSPHIKAKLISIRRERKSVLTRTFRHFTIKHIKTGPDITCLPPFKNFYNPSPWGENAALPRSSAPFFVVKWPQGQTLFIIPWCCCVLEPEKGSGGDRRTLELGSRVLRSPLPFSGSRTQQQQGTMNRVGPCGHFTTKKGGGGAGEGRVFAQGNGL